jgi:hypothetical protein
MIDQAGFEKSGRNKLLLPRNPRNMPSASASLDRLADLA